MDSQCFFKSVAFAQFRDTTFAGIDAKINNSQTLLCFRYFDSSKTNQECDASSARCNDVKKNQGVNIGNKLWNGMFWKKKGFTGFLLGHCPWDVRTKDSQWSWLIVLKQLLELDFSI